MRVLLLQRAYGYRNDNLADVARDWFGGKDFEAPDQNWRYCSIRDIERLKEYFDYILFYLTAEPVHYSIEEVNAYHDSQKT